MSQLPIESEGRVLRTSRVVLRTIDEPWPYALSNAEAIDAHWQRRRADNPAFYDGRVFVLRQLAPAAEAVEATFSLERFRAFLHWRDNGASPDAGLDGFGSALLRSAEGHALLARHAAGTLNAGLVYLPGGFLDASDARPDGTIDIDGAVARELREETGLDAGDLERVPGYIVARLGPHCCFAIEYRSPLPATELREQLRAGIGATGAPELSDIVIARRTSDLAALDVRSHARLLLEALFAGRV